ncbi:MAG: T9SS type A sorting domain-containing protein [Balneolaceae bacterium]
MKVALSLILLLTCPLLVSGQALVTIPDGAVPIDTTLNLPVNLVIEEGNSVSAIHTRFKFDSESFEFVGIERNGSISDSILAVVNNTDSTIIISFASTHPISNSGLLTSLSFTPKRIGFTEVVLTEFRIDENEPEFPDSKSSILITDEFGNSPPFFLDIPDTLTFFTGQVLEINLDDTFGDAQDEFEDLLLELTAEDVELTFSIDPIERILTLTAPNEEGVGTLNLKVTDSGGSSIDITIVIVVSLLVSNEHSGFGRDEFTLLQNYPNPFNPSTVISFSIPSSSIVKLSVYNMLGQEVASLLNTQLGAGSHRISFDATSLSSGIYLYRIQAGEFVQTKRMMLIK